MFTKTLGKTLLINGAIAIWSFVGLSIMEDMANAERVHEQAVIAREAKANAEAYAVWSVKDQIKTLGCQSEVVFSPKVAVVNNVKGFPKVRVVSLEVGQAEASKGNVWIVGSCF